MPQPADRKIIDLDPENQQNYKDIVSEYYGPGVIAVSPQAEVTDKYIRFRFTGNS